MEILDSDVNAFVSFVDDNCGVLFQVQEGFPEFR